MSYRNQREWDHAADSYTFGSSRFICTRCILELPHDHCDDCLGVMSPRSDTVCAYCQGKHLRDDVREMLDRAAIALRNAGWRLLSTELFLARVAEFDAREMASRIRGTRCSHAAIDSLLAMLDTLAQLQDVFDGLHKLLTDVADADCGAVASAREGGRGPRL